MPTIPSISKFPFWVGAHVVDFYTFPLFSFLILAGSNKPSYSSFPAEST